MKATKHEDHFDDDQPATRGEVSLLSGMLTSRLDAVENRLDRIEGRIDQLAETQAMILEIVQNVQASLNLSHDLPERMTAVENDVLKLKAAR